MFKWRFVLGLSFVTAVLLFASVSVEAGKPVPGTYVFHNNLSQEVSISWGEYGYEKQSETLKTREKSSFTPGENTRCFVRVTRIALYIDEEVEETCRLEIGPEYQGREISAWEVIKKGDLEVR